MFIKNFISIILLGVISLDARSTIHIETGNKTVNSSLINESNAYLFSVDVNQDSSFTSLKEDSIINIPFGTVSKQAAVNDITVINSSELLLYDNVTDASQLLGGRVAGLVGSLNIRGLGGALVVVDGIPRPLSSVNVNEIDQITVLKDANASILYGVQGNNGVILVKTKRGKPDRKVITGMVETGFNTPISFPEYLGSTEYMQLYNEARLNDGLDPLYSSATIEATRNGSNPTRYPDVDYYNAGFLKSRKVASRFITEFSGGNDKAQYYLNLGWLRSGSLMNEGGSGQHTNRLNLRSNIDFKINSFIKSNIDIVGIFNIGNTATGDFFRDASTIRPNSYPPLIDTALVNDKTLIRAGTLIDGKYLLGGSTIYRNNPYGYLNLGGFNKELGATVQFNNGLDFDLGLITEGLSLKTYLSFDFYNQYTEFQTNTYAVYQPKWTDDGAMMLSKIGADVFSGAQGINNTNLNRKMSISGLLDYKREIGDVHTISASLIGYVDRYNETGVFQSDKHSHFGTKLNYMYQGKYIFDFSSAITSSPKLAPGNRIAFSPSLGLGWILSEEGFLEGSSFIDFLKLRLSGGIINTDMGLNRYYAYENIYSYANSVTWNDGNRGNNATALSNPGSSNLFYEKRKEVNLGIQATLFNKALGVDVSVFQEYKTDLITTLDNTYPQFLGGLNSAENYNENSYSGIELSLNWRKSFNDFRIDIGSNMLFTKSKVVKRDEFWSEDYLYRAKKPTSAIFGLEALGLFNDDQDILGHAVQEFGAVQPGDIKYKDQNNDGFVNADDEVMLGQGASKFVSGLTVNLKYKNITLFALATVMNGSETFFNNSYYWLYGDRKFSEVARNRWTPQTSSTATYPRLSSQANSNNYRSSTFWLHNNSSISLDRVQLSYDIPKPFASKLYMNNLIFYLRVSNVANFSKNRDKMQLNIGTEPQYRFYAVGLKALF